MPEPHRAPVPTLSDGVVTLRGHRDDDLAGVHEQSQDPRSQAFTSIPVPYSPDDARAFVHEAVPRGWAEDTAVMATDLARRFQDAGVAAIIYTDIDRDGAMEGPNIAATEALARAVAIPVIASGGAGTLDHLVDAVEQGGADAVLCASIFHYGHHTVREAKERMRLAGIPVRL